MRFAQLAMSDSEAGSSARTSRTSPTATFDISALVLKTGSGQYSPVQSNVFAGDALLFSATSVPPVVSKVLFRCLLNAVTYHVPSDNRYACDLR